MSEMDLETMLRRYCVASPSPSLGRTIAARTSARDRGHLWGVLAAASVVAIWLAAHLARVTMSDLLREREVAIVTAALGGGDDARQYAEHIVPPRAVVVDPPSDGGTSW